MSRTAIVVADLAAAHAVIPERDEVGDSNRADPDPPADERDAAENALWRALCMAPEEGCEIAELIRLTGMDALDPLPPAFASMPGKDARSR